MGGLVRCGVVRGKSDGSLRLSRITIQRCDGATHDDEYAESGGSRPAGVRNRISPSVTSMRRPERSCSHEQQFTSSVGSYLSRFEQDLSAQHYTFAGFDQVYQVSSANSTYTR